MTLDIAEHVGYRNGAPGLWTTSACVTSLDSRDYPEACPIWSGRAPNVHRYPFGHSHESMKCPDDFNGRCIGSSRKVSDRIFYYSIDIITSSYGIKCDAHRHFTLKKEWKYENNTPQHHHIDGQKEFPLRPQRRNNFRCRPSSGYFSSFAAFYKPHSYLFCTTWRTKPRVGSDIFCLPLSPSSTSSHHLGIQRAPRGERGLLRRFSISLLSLSFPVFSFFS